MTKAYVEAQRYVPGDGWCPCEPHRADVWAVRVGARTLGRYQMKQIATEVLRQYQQRKRGPARRYALGAAMPKSGVPAVARSLTTAEYERITK